MRLPSADCNRICAGEAGEMGWHVEYYNIRERREGGTRTVDTREQAIDMACELMAQLDCEVRRIAGPNGEIVGLPEIKARFAECRAKRGTGAG